jgi:polysaccharide export outer membrane protein
MIKKHLLLILIGLGLITISCRPVRDVAYFQPYDSTEVKTTQKNSKVVYPNFNSKDTIIRKLPTFEAVIQPNDILSIYVSSLSPEASSFFNTISVTEKEHASENFSTKPNYGYLVNAQGEIEMPLVGKVKIGGYTTRQAHDTIVAHLEKYLQSPTVRLNIENFRVTILGEVRNPGVYTVTNEKLNLPEGVGLAGDMTIFADRREVLLIREENGVKTYNTIDFTRRDLFHSPFFYLHSNDIIYIRPVKGKILQSDNAVVLAPIIISSLTLMAVIINNIIVR